MIIEHISIKKEKRRRSLGLTDAHFAKNRPFGLEVWGRFEFIGEIRILSRTDQIRYTIS